jgi:hypothetical protein
MNFRFNLALRRGIQIPQDAEPCCPEGGSASGNSNRGYSPLSLEDITEVSSLLDNRGDIDFSEFTSFDTVSPFLQDLGSLEVNGLDARMPNHNALSSQQTPFSLHDSPENDPKVTTDDGQFSNPSYDTRGYQDTSTGLETDAQNHLCPPCPPSTTKTSDTIDSALLAEQHPSTASWTSTLLSSYKPESGDPMDLSGATGRACPSDGGSAANRTTITLDNIEPGNLFAIMNILFRSKASVKLEIQQ